MVLKSTLVVSFICGESSVSLGFFGVEIAVSFISVGCRETKEDNFLIEISV